MLTKTQKKESVSLSAKQIKASKNIVFADFKGVATKDINQLKIELRKANATLKVIKKRLLKIALKETGVEFDPTQFKAPIATIFAPNDLTSVAGPIYKFTKDLAKKKVNFTVVGVYDNEKKVVISDKDFITIAKLPGREALLGLVLGAMTGPLRAFMYIVDQLSKKQAALATPVAASREPVKSEEPKVENNK